MVGQAVMESLAGMLPGLEPDPGTGAAQYRYILGTTHSGDMFYSLLIPGEQGITLHPIYCDSTAWFGPGELFEYSNPLFFPALVARIAHAREIVKLMLARVGDRPSQQ